MASRPYDIVVFGSTGYTGKFVNEELYRLQNGGRQDLKWAAAGRSREKLQKSLSGTRNPLEMCAFHRSYKYIVVLHYVLRHEL